PFMATTMHLYNKLGFLSLALLLSLPLRAQKKQYTIAEATNGIATTLAPKGVKQPGWRPGTHQFFYRSDKGQLKMYDVDTKDSVIGDTAHRAYANRRSGFQWLQRNVDYFFANDSLSIHSMKHKERDTIISYFTSKLPKGAANLVVEPSTHSFAFTKDNN